MVEVKLGYGEDGHPAIKGAHIATHATVYNISVEQFQAHATRSSVTCTISKILNIEITLNAALN